MPKIKTINCGNYKQEELDKLDAAIVSKNVDLNKLSRRYSRELNRSQAGVRAKLKSIAERKFNVEPIKLGSTNSGLLDSLREKYAPIETMEQGVLDMPARSLSLNNVQLFEDHIRIYFLK